MSKQRTFEQSLEELEGVVRSLEGGKLTLDESLTAFEKGVGLARECETKLTEAKGTIEKLIQESNGAAKTEKLEVN